ncbi:hypothetical protein SLA2020_506360 [Shorea laevis]
MEDEKVEDLYRIINQKLRAHALINSSSRRIFKVPNHLRQINEKAYEPQVISIGPYHHGKEHLQAMEVQKMNSLKSLLDEGREDKVKMYVIALAEMEERARNFYSEPLDHIRSKEFVEMMLLDGCFIIELLFYSTTEKLFTPCILRKVMRDLLLVENQLPFFVLSKLFLLSRLMQPVVSGQPVIFEHDIPSMARDFLLTIVPGLPIIERRCYEDVKHLLGLLHYLSYSSEDRPLEVSVRISEEEEEEEERRRESIASSNLSAAKVIFPRPSNSTKWQFIRSATELNEAGVEFQKNEGDLFDIKFQKGVLSIPTLKIDDHTESILRNLVAYEQCYAGISSKRFTDYITFMDCLINTGKDVELLCRCGVLDNWLGDHKVVATMFNRLRDSVFISETNFFYTEIFNRVNKHCNRKRNSWKANLWHNYFNTPWALISFIAAVILLLSTLLQTLFSILSYHR